jgi:outer membrane biosynthesis protein TonB
MDTKPQVDKLLPPSRSGDPSREVAVSEEEPVIPGKSSATGLYIAGIVLLGGATIALLVWRSRASQPQVIAVPAPPVTTAAAPPMPQFAPPPPPKIEAEPEPTATAAAGTSAKAAGGGGPTPCGKCGGDGAEGSAALSSAISSAAAGARGCYNRALQKGEVSGKMNVSVQVGSNGQVCSAAITSDTVGSSQVSSCVLSRFQGRSFPPPTRGCVVVNVPINFTIKQ